MSESKWQAAGGDSACTAFSVAGVHVSREAAKKNAAEQWRDEAVAQGNQCKHGRQQ